MVTIFECFSLFTGFGSASSPTDKKSQYIPQCSAGLEVPTRARYGAMRGEPTGAAKQAICNDHKPVRDGILPLPGSQSLPTKRRNSLQNERQSSNTLLLQKKTLQPPRKTDRNTNIERKNKTFYSVDDQNPLYFHERDNMFNKTLFTYRPTCEK